MKKRNATKSSPEKRRPAKKVKPKAAKARRPPSAKQVAHRKNPFGGFSGPGAPPGKRLLTRVKEMLQEKSRREDGKYNTRFDDVANAFVMQMEQGSMPHTKEFIDREEGKVPDRLANADGSNVKVYVGMPVDGDEAP